MSESKTTIETSQLQNNLQRIYWKVIVYIVIWTSVLSVVFLIKSILIYYLLPITHIPLLEFLLSPETNSVEDTKLNSLYETILSVLAMIMSFALMMISTKAEKLYIAAFGKIDDIEIFLYSIEIKNIPNIVAADLLARIFESLRGDSISPSLNAIQHIEVIFNMEDYFQAKNNLMNIIYTDKKLEQDIKKARESREGKNHQTSVGGSKNGLENQSENGTKTYTKSQTNTFSKTQSQSKSRLTLVSKGVTIVGGFETLIEKFNQMPKDNFNGKIIMTFRNLEMVYDILLLYNVGLLNVKLRSDYESVMNLGLLGGQPSKLKEALDEENKEALCNVIKITAARDPNDIIWSYYGLPDSQKLSDKRWRILMCFIISIIISFLVAVVYYLSIRELLKLKFIDSTGAWTISLGETKIFMNWKLILMMIVTLVVPMMGWLIVEALVIYIQMDFYSDYNNLRFRLEILFEVLHRYVFIHFAFAQACKDTRDLMDSKDFDKLYRYIYIEWNKIAALLIMSTVMRYLVKHLVRFFEKIKKRKTPEKINFSIDHSISSTNLLLTFMYMGFYFPVLSVSIVALLTINMLLNMLMYYFVYKNNKILREYLSYNNISMLINHCLVAFNVGGVLSLWIHVDFTRAYFRGANQWSGQLPSNFIGSVFMLLFAFINYMLNQPNSLRIRVLQNIMTLEKYDGSNLLYDEALKTKNFSNKNPFRIELKELKNNEMAASRIKDFSQVSMNDVSPLMGSSRKKMRSVSGSFLVERKMSQKNERKIRNRKGLGLKKRMIRDRKSENSIEGDNSLEKSDQEIAGQLMDQLVKLDRKNR